MRNQLILAILLLVFVSFACNPYSQDSYREYIVVESYAIANDLLPNVSVRFTTKTDLEYNRSDLLIDDADVQIVLLDESGLDQEIFEFRFSSNTGKYLAVNKDHRILPTRTYRLDVSFDDRPDVIQSTTTVPDDFEVINEQPVSIFYQSENQLELVLSPTQRTQSQNVFVFTAIALEVSLENLTPFYLSAFNNEDDAEISDFSFNSSGLINEDNFERNPDGTTTLKYPWLGIAFYGETKVVTHSVDKNIVDLIRSQEVQLGGSTLSPGEIPNLIYNVEGGIGVFGSLSADTVSTTFLNPF